MRKLPRAQRQGIESALLEETEGEAASRFGCDAACVRMARSRGRARLVAVLKERTV
jgi:hypothetical protein